MESRPVAEALNALGYNAVIFRYSVGKHFRWPQPLEEFDQAMEYLTAHTEEYYIDPVHIVAVWFFCWWARDRLCRCIVLWAGRKGNITVLRSRSLDAAELVNLDTRPMFLASSRKDWIMPVTDTTKLIGAPQDNYIDYEGHIHGYALHGFSVGEAAGAKGPLFCSRVGEWVDDFLAWLDELISGWYKSIRECVAYNDRYGEVLSTMNSCEVLLERTEAVAVLKRRFPALYLLLHAAKKQVGAFTDTVSPRNVL